MADLNLTLDESALLHLAHENREFVGAAQSAGVTDGEGKRYVAAQVHLPSLDIPALSLAVAMAVGAGAKEIQSAVIVSNHGMNAVVNLDALRDVVGKNRRVVLGDDAGQAIALRTT